MKLMLVLILKERQNLDSTGDGVTKLKFSDRVKKNKSDGNQTFCGSRLVSLMHL
jgi:hypothetical protein